MKLKTFVMLFCFHSLVPIHTSGGKRTKSRYLQLKNARDQKYACQHEISPPPESTPKPLTPDQHLKEAHKIALYNVQQLRITRQKEEEQKWKYDFIFLNELSAQWHEEHRRAIYAELKHYRHTEHSDALLYELTQKFYKTNATYLYYKEQRERIRTERENLFRTKAKLNNCQWDKEDFKLKSYTDTTQENSKSATRMQDDSPHGCSEEFSLIQALLARLTLDFQNYREQMEKDRMLWANSAHADALLPLFNIVDNFGHALEDAKKQLYIS